MSTSVAAVTFGRGGTAAAAAPGAGAAPARGGAAATALGVGAATAPGGRAAPAARCGGAAALRRRRRGVRVPALRAFRSRVAIGSPLALRCVVLHAGERGLDVPSQILVVSPT